MKEPCEWLIEIMRNIIYRRVISLGNGSAERKSQTLRGCDPLIIVTSEIKTRVDLIRKIEAYDKIVKNKFLVDEGIRVVGINTCSQSSLAS